MNVNLYLPDELGRRAKEADLPLSQLLQRAVADELERRKTVSETLAEAQVHEIAIEDDDGRVYTGRITGAEIAYAEAPELVTVYLTDDERVILYNGDQYKYWVLSDPEEELRDLPPAVYEKAMHALGIKPVIDL